MLIGHVYMANKDPIARLGMRTGGVPQSWAEREHGAWAQSEQPEPDAPAGPTPGSAADDAVSR